MADEDHQFDCAESGASKTYPKQCSALRKNDFVVIKSHPCKIVDMSTSKTGKHGHAKVHLVGIDVFTGKKYEDICPSTHNMSCPIVLRSEYTVIDIEKDFMCLMDDSGVTREDLRCPAPESEIYTQFIEKKSKLLSDGQSFLVTVMKAMEEELVVAIKQDKAEKP